MKNKFNETDIDFGNTCHIVPKSNDNFSENEALPNEQEFDLRKIKYPLATREIVQQLLALVNSEAEYKLLLKELAELDEIIASQSSKLKGGASQKMSKTADSNQMGVRVLPQVRIQSKTFTIDLRLGEFRNTETLDSIAFNSEEGQLYCQLLGIHKCGSCNRYIMLPYTDCENLVCPVCGRKLTGQFHVD
jgi:hypothetical protein